MKKKLFPALLAAEAAALILPRFFSAQPEAALLSLAALPLDVYKRQGLGVAEAELHRGIALFFRGLLLGDHTGTGLDDGDRNDVAALIEDLGHAHFFADDCFLHLVVSSCFRLLVGAIGQRQHDPSVLLMTNRGGQLQLGGLQLYLNLNAGGKIEGHQSLDGLLVGVEDIDQSLVGPALELLA